MRQKKEYEEKVKKLFEEENLKGLVLELLRTQAARMTNSKRGDVLTTPQMNSVVKILRSNPENLKNYEKWRRIHNCLALFNNSLTIAKMGFFNAIEQFRLIAVSINVHRVTSARLNLIYQAMPTQELKDSITPIIEAHESLQFYYVEDGKVTLDLFQEGGLLDIQRRRAETYVEALANCKAIIETIENELKRLDLEIFLPEAIEFQFNTIKDAPKVIGRMWFISSLVERKEQGETITEENSLFAMLPDYKDVKIDETTQKEINATIIEEIRRIYES